MLLFILIYLTGSSLVSRSYAGGVIKPRRWLELEVGTAELKLNVWYMMSESLG